MDPPKQKCCKRLFNFQPMRAPEIRLSPEASQAAAGSSSSVAKDDNNDDDENDGHNDDVDDDGAE